MIREIAAFVLLTFVIFCFSMIVGLPMNLIVIRNGFFVIFGGIWVIYGLIAMSYFFGRELFEEPLIPASLFCLVAGIGMWLYLLGVSAGGGSCDG